MRGRQQPAKVIVWSLIRVQNTHFKSFHGNGQFSIGFLNFNVYDSETALKKNYSSDRALFGLKRG